MDDTIEIIRTLATEIADQFSAYADHHAAKNAMEKSLTNLEFRNRALAIVDQLDGLATFRENALDLSAVPEEITIEIWCVALSRPGIDRKIWTDGEGPTPSAALAAAIARVGK